MTDTVRRKDAVSPQTLAAAPGLALAVGCATGAVVGGALGVIVMAGASADDDWAAVGALVAGAAVGALVAVGVYVAALVAAARRLFPPGRRARPVLHTLIGQTAVAAYGAALLAVLRPSSMGWTVLVVLLTAGAAACAPAAFVWSGTSGRPRRIAIAAVLVPTLLGGGVVAGTNTAAEVRTGRVAADLPLVLFDGSTADPVFPGWRRDRFSTLALRRAHSFTDRGHEAYLKYLTPAGVAFVTMHTDAGSCNAPSPGYTCVQAGRLQSGELRSYLRTTPYGGYPQAARYLVLVYPDGSAVSVNLTEGANGPDGLTEEKARHVLAALERVDRDRFEERTDSRLSLG